MGCVLVNCLICIIRTLSFNEGRINIRRLKNGFSTVHPLRFDEREAVERWTQERANWKGADRTDAIFISRRGSRLSRQQAYRIMRNAGIEAGTVTQTHPHMLRHASGYELAERGADTRLIQDYLGHRNIRHTVCIPPVMLLVLPDYGKEII
ncbi:tyrosine-type DNA invertase [Escherichia coli]